MKRDGVLQYLVGDHLGTTSVVLDADGHKVAEARHYPYGEERWRSGTFPTDYIIPVAKRSGVVSPGSGWRPGWGCTRWARGGTTRRWGGGSVRIQCARLLWITRSFPWR